jgi:hypothetical protein
MKTIVEMWIKLAWSLFHFKFPEENEGSYSTTPTAFRVGKNVITQYNLSCIRSRKNDTIRSRAEILT